jgi:hypothetical protein
MFQDRRIHIDMVLSIVFILLEWPSDLFAYTKKILDQDLRIPVSHPLRCVDLDLLCNSMLFKRSHGYA